MHNVPGGGNQGQNITIRELREKLSALSHLDDNTKVVACLERKHGQQFFEIDDIEPVKGTPVEVKGKKQFQFDTKTGPVKWLFINITEA